MESDVKFSWTLLKKEYKPILAGLGIFLVLLFLKKASFLFGTISLVFCAFLLVISAFDIRYTLVFDKVLLLFVAVFAVFYPLQSDILPQLTDGIMYGALCAGFFLFVRFLKGGGVGGGDIKLVFCLGLWLGYKLILAIYTAVLLALVFAIFTPKYRKKQARIPFAPFLALSSAAAFLYGEKIFSLAEEYFLWM